MVRWAPKGPAGTSHNPNKHRNLWKWISKFVSFVTPLQYYKFWINTARHVNKPDFHILGEIAILSQIIKWAAGGRGRNSHGPDKHRNQSQEMWYGRTRLQQETSFCTRCKTTLTFDMHVTWIWNDFKTVFPDLVRCRSLIMHSWMRCPAAIFDSPDKHWNSYQKVRGWWALVGRWCFGMHCEDCKISNVSMNMKAKRMCVCVL